MRLIAAGSFRMGSGKDDSMSGFDEKPLTPTDTRSYCIDYFEFPNRGGGMPLANVNFAQAEASCKARNKRLCAEEEWERACKGPNSARFPYGAAFDADICNTQDAAGEARSVAASGAFAKCRSAYGVADMGGVDELQVQRRVGRPDDQGRGVGSAGLRHALRRAQDRQPRHAQRQARVPLLRRHPLTPLLSVCEAELPCDCCSWRWRSLVWARPSCTAPRSRRWRSSSPTP
jgi:GNAT superfamily N-acetyltransferase